MGRKSKKQSNTSNTAPKPVASPEQTAAAPPIEEVHEGGDDVVQKQAQHAMMGVLQQAAKKDMETLKSENADAVRERLAKSQKVAREILAALKLERSYSEQLEELLREKGIDVPPRPPKEA
ncbi:hypothetical protein CYMTET_29783 [Cymbomonas tetramitiformis]|uniref:Uncharacterized protein n=1 Tax=Cymbomonas tetramitiformis TaxID=36881 RepID=A0AAE0KUU5_9CHLO|nr:hypothetical protein CYMTET_29783 [Cymbomonas tetramitiformis]